MEGLNLDNMNTTEVKEKIVVIKYGGSTIAADSSTSNLLKQIVQLNKLGIKVILVHGGGPEISSLMQKLDIKPNFIEGLRVTDEATLNIAKMALIGKINKDIVTTISTLGGTALGLSGIDGNLLLCNKKYIKKIENGVVNMIDGGFIGEVVKVNTVLLNMLLSNNIIPVIAPIGIGSNGENFNINGDDAASAIASAMEAHVFALVSDVDGVYLDINDKSTRIKKLTITEAEELVEKGVIKGGMIPKIRCSVNAVKKGVKSVFIISGLVEDNLVKNIVKNEMTGTIIEA